VQLTDFYVLSAVHN